MVGAKALVALALLISGIAVAQRQFDLCYLTIHVRASDERDLRDRVQIELLSPSGTPVATAQTNDDGVAYFQVSSGITYLARIFGKGIESTTTEFSILGGQPSHTENLTVKRVSKGSQAGISPTVSVLEINVPGKAREEMQKGEGAFDHGDMVKARQHFERATALYPQYARGYVNLGVVALRSGDRRGARDSFLKAIQVDDKYVPAYLHLARWESREKNFTQAETFLGKALLLDPGLPETFVLLADAEYGNKEFDKALADAQRAHSLAGHEQFATVHLLAAQILEMQNRNQEAIAEYNAFLSEAPKSPQASAVKKAIADLQTETHSH
jgi:Tfp pilus assembly protein PilF